MLKGIKDESRRLGMGRSGAMNQCISAARMVGAWDSEPKTPETPEVFLRFGGNAGTTSRKAKRAMATILQAYKNGLIDETKACEMARQAQELRDPEPKPSRAKRIARLEAQIEGVKGLKALSAEQVKEIEERHANKGRIVIR